MPISIQKKLAKLRALFKDPERDSNKQIFSLGYTVPNPDDEYTELILNLTWSLVGDWKYLNLVNLPNAEIYLDTLNNVRSSSDHFKRNNYVHSLYQHSEALKFSVKAIDLYSGINGLYKIATKNIGSAVEEFNFEKKGMIYPKRPILIKKEGDFYEAYCFVSEDKESSFANIFH